MKVFRNLLSVAIVCVTMAVCVASDRDTEYGQLLEAVRQKAADPVGLKAAMATLDGCCAKSPDLKQRVPEDIKRHLADIRNPIQRAELLAALIASDNLWRDQRQLRQWIDELEELADEETLPYDCRCRCILAMGEKEFWTGNFVDAEKSFGQLVEMAEEQRDDATLVKVLDDLALVYLRVGDQGLVEHLFKRKMTIVGKLASAPDVQAESYASSVMTCALLRDWKNFDAMCERSLRADGGRHLCRQLIPLLLANMNGLLGRRVARQIALEELGDERNRLWTGEDEEVFAAWAQRVARDSQFVRNMENNFAVADFIRKASGGGFPLVEFNRILEKTCGIPEKTMEEAGEAWAGDALGVKFLFDLMKCEAKISKGMPCADVREELAQLKPVPFEIMQTKFSVQDAEALLLQIRLGVCQRLGDWTASGNLARKLNALLAEVSQPFLSLASDECKAQIAEVWIEQGKVRKARDLLLPIVKRRLTAGDSTIDIRTYYNLGRAYRQLGALDDAEWCLNEAYQFVQPGGGFNFPRGYDKYTSFYGADVCTECAALLAAKQASPEEIDGRIGLAIKMALQGGHPDALGRAYQEALKNLFTNEGLSRKEKLAKIEKMKTDCLAATSNPLLLARFFSACAKFEYANNMSAKKIVKEIEQYFQYQQLYAGLTEVPRPAAGDSEMRDMLLTLLGEMNDAAGLDYWNKVFEKRKTRSAEISAMTASGDAKAQNVIPILLQVSKYEAASEILRREQAKPEGGRDPALLAKATEIKRELERHFDEAQKTLPPDSVRQLRDLLADSLTLHPDAMGQLCSVLPEDVVCLQFLLVGEKILVSVAARGATPFIETIHLKDKGVSAREVNREIVKLRAKIQTGADGKALERELKSLHDVLFADVRPVLERLNCRRLIVNCSGMLRYVPFAALSDGEKYLVERYQVSHVTGLDLIRLAKAEPRRRVDSVKTVVFADPDGSLPAGREEGRRVAELFKDSRLLVGEQASLANFESLMGDVNFIHLATHAVLDADKPKNSYILFADGRHWRYCDMMGFCVENVDSMVLSACSTAVGEKSDGGEIEGMAYQLLRKSPSGSVLASFWKVDDAATAKLMSVYYDHLATAMKERGVLDRGGALRAAQLALLNRAETASPYYWAAFSLFGDFR